MLIYEAERQGSHLLVHSPNPRISSESSAGAQSKELDPGLPNGRQNSIALLPVASCLFLNVTVTITEMLYGDHR